MELIVKHFSELSVELKSCSKYISCVSPFL